jgi:D-threo-aldose 1-dehydrogenase
VWRGRLPTLGLGAAPLGNLYAPVGEAEAVALLEVATDSGDAYIDTAPYYGHGLSERRIGDFLRAHPRCHPLISTKAGRRLEPCRAAPDHGFAQPAPFRPVFDYSASGIRLAVEESLQRLGRPSIDLLLLHDVGRATHGADHSKTMTLVEREAWPVLQAFQAEGLTRGIGLAVNECEVVLECFDRGLIPDVVLLAGRHTLLDASAERTGVIERCQAEGVTLICAAPFNSGLLAGGDRFNYVPASPGIVESRRRLAEICTAFGVPLPVAALQFPLRNPAITTVLAGARTVAELRQQRRWLNYPTSEELWHALENLRARYAL